MTLFLLLWLFTGFLMLAIAMTLSDKILTPLLYKPFVYPKNLLYESYYANIPPFGFKLFVRFLFILLSVLIFCII